jgi:hypothetical protein
MKNSVVTKSFRGGLSNYVSSSSWDQHDERSPLKRCNSLNIRILRRASASKCTDILEVACPSNRFCRQRR